MGKKVSVIVPIYKVEKYLERCIESIIRQTYDNLEIILVDDGSPDSCGNICDIYAEKDNRIKVIHKGNGGLSDARNAGIRIATGDIISYVDSDDWIEQNMIADMVNLLESHQADIVVCGCNYTDGHNISSPYKTDEIVDYSSDEAIELVCQSDRIKSHAWDKIYRKEVLDGIEFPVGKLYEDVYVMHEIFKRANRITFVDHPYYFYYQRSGSIVSERTLQSFVNLIMGMEKRLDDLHDYPETTKEWVRFWIIRSIIDAHRIMSQLNIIDDTYRRKFLELVQKYDPDGHLGNRLDGNMKTDYLFLRHFPVLYSGYRRTVNGLKSSDLKHGLGRIKRFCKKRIIFVQNALKPVSTDIVELKNIHPKIVLMGGPEYDNLGDHAIAYATQKFIERNIPDIPYCEITEKELETHLLQIRKMIHPDDILLLQGGGNLGNIYQDQQRIRKKVLSTFPENYIILMPQTCYFSKDEAGTKELDKTCKLFETHQNLKLLAREKYSHQFMLKQFSRVESYLIPDIVLSLNVEYRKKRKGVGLCIRNDCEGILEIAEKNFLMKICKDRFSTLSIIDTCGSQHFSKNERESVLLNFFSQISSYEMVITDRLHGVIFCAITGTPCIALSNSNYKIMGICEWLKIYPWIRYCENVYNIENIIEDIIKATNGVEERCINLQSDFLQLVDFLRGENK